MNHATLLVITPTLGESAFLDSTMASVVALGLPVIHVLAAPPARMAALRERYPHATVVKDAGRSGGIYGALNEALLATPEGWDWFTYINDDDRLLPGFRDMVQRHCAQPAPEPVTYGNVELIDESGRHLGVVTVEPNPRWIPALLQEGISPVMQQGMLFHRDCVTRLGGFDTRYRLCADLDFWLRARAAGEPFRYYDLPVAQFRLRRGQLSSNTARTILEQDSIVRRHFPEQLPAWRRQVARWRYRIHNFPRYLERTRRARSLRTSYQMLEHRP
ncbi:MAG TPA: glycosyltransferase [Candidatus Didemnitutus sp.]|nr:glycosyltransferase [Candidatus Didemnitutus sp.]